MNQEYSIGHKYIIIMQQVIQTNDPQIVNRIEIGEVIAETKAYLLLKTLTTKRYVKKSLIIRLIDISSIYNLNTQFFIDKIEGALI
jgi:RNase P/RNase MRP subunit p29